MTKLRARSLLLRVLAGASWCAVLSALVPTGSRAQDRSAEPFAQGTWSLATEGSYIAGGDAELVRARAIVSIHVADRLAIGIGAAAYDIWRGDGERESGGGADLLIRYYLFTLERFAPFLELGGGMMVAGFALPRDSSDWNFTPQARAGFVLELIDRLHLELSGGWWHASNGGLEDQNSGFNGGTASGALMLLL